MASYPWEHNAGAEQLGDVRLGGGGGGGPIDERVAREVGEAAKHAEPAGDSYQSPSMRGGFDNDPSIPLGE
jgi:hypothetical protein